MHLKLIPITTNETEMQHYLGHPFCLEVFNVFKEYYPEIGFNLPWVGYFVLQNNEVIGAGGFKGPPKNNKVEIGYTTLPEKQGNGYGSKICGELVNTALKFDFNIRITARTLMEESASTNILKKNGFKYIGVVNDPNDGEVWEWEYMHNLTL